MNWLFGCNIFTTCTIRFIPDRYHRYFEISRVGGWLNSKIPLTNYYTNSFNQVIMSRWVQTDVCHFVVVAISADLNPYRSAVFFWHIVLTSFKHDHTSCRYPIIIIVFYGRRSQSRNAGCTAGAIKPQRAVAAAGEGARVLLSLLESGRRAKLLRVC